MVTTGTVASAFLPLFYDSYRVEPAVINLSEKGQPLFEEPGFVLTKSLLEDQFLVPCRCWMTAHAMFHGMFVYICRSDDSDLLKHSAL